MASPKSTESAAEQRARVHATSAHRNRNPYENTGDAATRAENELLYAEGGAYLQERLQTSAEVSGALIGHIIEKQRDNLCVVLPFLTRDATEKRIAFDVVMRDVLKEVGKTVAVEVNANANTKLATDSGMSKAYALAVQKLHQEQQHGVFEVSENRWLTMNRAQLTSAFQSLSQFVGPEDFRQILSKTQLPNRNELMQRLAGARTDAERIRITEEYLVPVTDNDIRDFLDHVGAQEQMFLRFFDEMQEKIDEALYQGWSTTHEQINEIIKNAHGQPENIAAQLAANEAAHAQQEQANEAAHAQKEQENLKNHNHHNIEYAPYAAEPQNQLRIAAAQAGAREEIRKGEYHKAKKWSLEGISELKFPHDGKAKENLEKLNAQKESTNLTPAERTAYETQKTRLNSQIGVDEQQLAQAIRDKANAESDFNAVKSRLIGAGLTEAQIEAQNANLAKRNTAEARRVRAESGITDAVVAKGAEETKLDTERTAAPVAADRAALLAQASRDLSTHRASWPFVAAVRDGFSGQTLTAATNAIVAAWGAPSAGTTPAQQRIWAMAIAHLLREEGRNAKITQLQATVQTHIDAREDAKDEIDDALNPRGLSIADIEEFQREKGNVATQTALVNRLQQQITQRRNTLADVEAKLAPTADLDKKIAKAKLALRVEELQKVIDASAKNPKTPVQMLYEVWEILRSIEQFDRTANPFSDATAMRGLQTLLGNDLARRREMTSQEIPQVLGNLMEACDLFLHRLANRPEEPIIIGLKEILRQMPGVDDTKNAEGVVIEKSIETKATEQFAEIEKIREAMATGDVHGLMGERYEKQFREVIPMLELELELEKLDAKQIAEIKKKVKVARDAGDLCPKLARFIDGLTPVSAETEFSAIQKGIWGKVKTVVSAVGVTFKKGKRSIELRHNKKILKQMKEALAKKRWGTHSEVRLQAEARMKKTSKDFRDALGAEEVKMLQQKEKRTQAEMGVLLAIANGAPHERVIRTAMGMAQKVSQLRADEMASTMLDRAIGFLQSIGYPISDAQYQAAQAAAAMAGHHSVLRGGATDEIFVDRTIAQFQAIPPVSHALRRGTMEQLAKLHDTVHGFTSEAYEREYLRLKNPLLADGGGRMNNAIRARQIEAEAARIVASKTLATQMEDGTIELRRESRMDRLNAWFAEGADAKDLNFIKMLGRAGLLVPGSYLTELARQFAADSTVGRAVTIAEASAWGATMTLAAGTFVATPLVLSATLLGTAYIALKGTQEAGIAARRTLELLGIDPESLRSALKVVDHLPRKARLEMLNRGHEFSRSDPSEISGIRAQARYALTKLSGLWNLTLGSGLIGVGAIGVVSPDAAAASIKTAADIATGSGSIVTANGFGARVLTGFTAASYAAGRSQREGANDSQWRLAA